MPVIEHQIAINAPVERAYAVLKDVEHYAEYLPHVKAVKVLQRSADGNEALIEWTIIAPGVGMEIKWQAQHQWNDETYQHTFQPAGESMVQLDGEWRVQPEGNGSQLSIRVNYEAKVPPMFQGMAKNAVNELNQSWANALKRQAEA